MGDAVADQLVMPTNVCSLVVFKHIEKTGGTALGAWFKRLEAHGWLSYHGIVQYPRSCALTAAASGEWSWSKKVAAPGVRAQKDDGSSCAAAEPEAKYIFAQFEARFAGTPQHIDGWQVVPRSALANRTRGVSANALLPWSVVLEVHNHDSHLKPLLDRIEQARRVYPGLGDCRVFALTVWRSPFSHYKSKYHFYKARGYIGRNATLDWFMHKDRNSQTNDLLRGVAHGTYWQSFVHQSDDELERLGNETLARFALVGHTERLEDLILLLCAKLRLPQCPCLFHENVGHAHGNKESADHGRDASPEATDPNRRYQSAVGEVAPVDIALFGRVKQHFAAHYDAHVAAHGGTPQACTKRL